MVKFIEIHRYAAEYGRVIGRVQILPVAQIVGELLHGGQRLARKHVAVQRPVYEQYGIVAAELAPEFVQGFHGGVGFIQIGVRAQIHFRKVNNSINHQRGDYHQAGEHEIARAQHPVGNALEEVAQAQ